METCVLGREELLLPEAIIENLDVLEEVVSLKTWEKVLNDGQRKHLMKFLPTFSKGTTDQREKQETLKRLFTGKNFKFGNPIRLFHGNLKDGTYSPDIAKYTVMCRKAKIRDYRLQQQRYYSDLLKEVIVNRQHILEQVYKMPPDVPIKVTCLKPTPAAHEHTIQHRADMTFARVMREVQDECNIQEDSSDEDDGESHLDRSRKTLVRSLLNTKPSEKQTTNVQSTFAIRPLTNGESSVDAGRDRAYTPPVLDDNYLIEQLRNHRKRRLEGEEGPDLETRGITIEDVIARIQPAKKSNIKPSASVSLFETSLSKSKTKTKQPKKKKIKIIKDEPEVPMVSLLSTNENQAWYNENIPMDIKEETLDVGSEFATHTSMGEGLSNEKSSFFTLLRDTICGFPEAKVTTIKVEESVREWQDNPASVANDWYSLHDNWTELVQPALKFLSGDVLGTSIENFIPFIDYKERAQQWKWIGQGRDHDDDMDQYFHRWLETNPEAGQDEADNSVTAVPPARSKTSYTVQPSSREDKLIFQAQEVKRFDTPHRAFTYRVHGYDCVVGPVKGVYAKESSMTKAREHALLVKDRPAYVTILTLVRDAAARLPNGEGTRADICELLKDSKFLSSIVTDSQINTVVSGALDRLHYEKDPCVKYDVNRKVWIYLHRNRSEDEFERIHQAHGAFAKAKKSLQKPKLPKQKAAKESPVPPGSLTITQTPRPESALSSASNDSINIMDVGSPVRTAQSPKSMMLGQSAKILQMSPRGSQASPKGQNHPSPRSVSSLTSPVLSPSQLLTQTGVGSPQSSPRPVVPSTTQASALLTLMNQSTPKGMAVTFVQPQGTTGGKSIPSPQPGLTGSQPVTFNLVHSQPARKVSEMLEAVKKQQFQQPGKSSPQQLSQMKTQLTSQSPSSSPAPQNLRHVTPATKPTASKLVQQMSNPQQQQVLSMGSVLASTISGAQKQGTTTIKIQGGMMQPLQKSVTVTTGTVDKVTSLSSPLTSTALTQILQSGGKPASMVKKTVGKQGKFQGQPLTILSGGKPVSAGSQKIQLGGQPVAIVTQTGDQPGTPVLINGKPAMIGGKPLAMIGGKPVLISGGKPIQLTGKPMSILQSQQSSSSPQRASPSTPVSQQSQLLAAALAQGQPQPTASTQGLTISSSVVSQILQQATLSQQSATTKSSPSTNPQASQGKVPGQVIQTSQGKVIGPGQVLQTSQGKVVVTQIPGQGNVTLKSTGNTAQSGGPTQYFVQSGTGTQGGTTRVMTPQQFIAGGGNPVQISGKPIQLGGKPIQIGGKPIQIGGKPIQIGGKPIQLGGKPIQIGGKPIQIGGKPIQIGGKPGQNVQFVKRVLTQPGGKPSQTIVLTQPTYSSPQRSPVVTSAGQPGLSSPKRQQQVADPSTKKKVEPAYARIITPPPGMKFTGVRPGHGTTTLGVCVTQGQTGTQIESSPASQDSSD
ncbi:unnamed protein product [Owenia fusiformis]|uniref:Uncharacterized protein n=1 Tax=Owenia fusiformis TaxID=6347 RepID=A0A8J1TWX8_OWEFU|nr:unnamed protein product [Owenia fusiformis]